MQVKHQVGSCIFQVLKIKNDRWCLLYPLSLQNINHLGYLYWGKVSSYLVPILFGLFLSNRILLPSVPFLYSRKGRLQLQMSHWSKPLHGGLISSVSDCVMRAHLIQFSETWKEICWGLLGMVSFTLRKRHTSSLLCCHTLMCLHCEQGEWKDGGNGNLGSKGRGWINQSWAYLTSTCLWLLEINSLKAP